MTNASGCALRCFCYESQLFSFLDHGREGTTLFGDSHVGGDPVVEHRNHDNAFQSPLVELGKSESLSVFKVRVV